MAHLIHKLAYKFAHNKLAILLFRPLYRRYNARIYEKKNKLFLKNAIDVARAITTLFQNNNIQYWFEFGSLLGAYRDHGFIPHDFDIDLGVMFKDKAAIREILISNGFKLVREFTTNHGDEYGCEQTYSYLGIPIDLFFFHINGTQMYCNSFRHKPNGDSYNTWEVEEVTLPYSGFKAMDFLGITIQVPKNIEMHLKSNYGENFMIPDPNFSYADTATNVKWYPIEERYGIIKEYV